MRIRSDAYISKKLCVSDDVFNAPFEISLVYMWW